MHSFKKEYEADFEQLREENAKRIKTLASSTQPPSYESHHYTFDKTLFLIPTATTVEIGAAESPASSPGVERIEFLPMIEDVLVQNAYAQRVPQMVDAEAGIEAQTESSMSVSMSAEQQSDAMFHRQPSAEQSDAMLHQQPSAEQSDAMFHQQPSEDDIEYIDYDDLYDDDSASEYSQDEHGSPSTPEPTAIAPLQIHRHSLENYPVYNEIEAFCLPEPKAGLEQESVPFVFEQPEIQPVQSVLNADNPLATNTATANDDTDATPSISNQKYNRLSLTRQDRKGKSQECRLLIMSSREILCWREPF